MEIREVILHALFRRVQQGDMELEQVPIPYQKPLQELLDVTEGKQEPKK